MIVVVLPRRLAPPVVVLELMLGIVIGPQVLGIAEPDAFIDFFSNLGLGMLFFFAGYEIDFERIRGKPLSLGAWGWLCSLVLAYGIGGALAAAGIVVSFLYTGSALATTAIGTLIPILRDDGRAADQVRQLPARRPVRWASSGRSCWSRSCSRPPSRCTRR